MKNPLVYHTSRERPYPTDHLLGATVLRLIPSRIPPNAITILRFLLCPYVFYLFLHGDYGWGFWVFLFTAFTDAIDGAMARLRKQITIWGTLYDPVADKLLIGGTVLILAWKNLGTEIIFLIVGLEIATVLGALYFRLRRVIYPANLYGKIKMLLQVVAASVLILGLIFQLSVLFSVSYGIFILACVFAFLSLASRGQ